MRARSGNAPTGNSWFSELVEGLNNKLRIISRRAYGFHSAEALIAMLFLNVGGMVRGELDEALRIWREE